MFLALAFSIGFFGAAQSATITITLSGSSLPGLTGTPTKTYTISDTDLQTVLNWGGPYFGVSGAQNSQILLAWFQGMLITPTVNAIQNQQRQQQPLPTPISIQ